MPELCRFHLAFPVASLAAARAFYGGLLGCREGRASPEWVDFDFYGHQIVAHVSDEARVPVTNLVDGDEVPVRHFGVILTPDAFHVLAARLADAHTPFLVAPHVRFQGGPGEQWTMFITDPSGNALEFKAFADDAYVFRR